MGDKPTLADANSKVEADARRVKQQGADSSGHKPPAPQPPAPQDGKPFPNPAKNTDVPEEHPPESPIKRRYPEPTD
jgi:hypothetical protein